LRWWSRIFLEEFLFLAHLILVLRPWRRILRGRGRLHLRLRRLWLPLRRTGLVRFVFAATAATAMAVRLHLTIVRCGPLFWLGLR
jgi:hypothetical protein